MMKALILFAVASVFLPFIASASSSTVGDGGFGVVCKSEKGQETVESIDTFLIRYYDPEFACQPGSSDFKAKIEAIRDNTKVRLALSEEQLARFDQAVRAFLYATEHSSIGAPPDNVVVQPFQIDWDYQTDGQLFDYFQGRLSFDCRITTNPLATRFKREKRDASCAGDYCFWVDRDMWKRLNEGEKLALVAHEALRFLPEYAQPASVSLFNQYIALVCR